MKIILTKDDGTEEVFQDVIDCYLAVRQLKHSMNDKNEMASLTETRSYSWGSNTREITKEIYQSWLELQKILEARNGNSNTA